jgi:hypothetical protein
VPDLGRSETSVCEQCGRVGTRGFKTLITFLDGRAVGPITVCSNTNACRKRWPKVSDDELDRRYA